MFARYDKEEKEYIEIHKSLNGMVMIFEDLRTDDELIQIGKETNKYLNQYHPILPII